MSHQGSHRWPAYRQNPSATQKTPPLEGTLPNTGLEVDAIVETAAGRWLAAEVKLGGGKAIDAAARSLLKLRARVDTVAAGEPTKLMVVTAVGGYCYDRPDGVAVVPVTALGP